MRMMAFICIRMAGSSLLVLRRTRGFLWGGLLLVLTRVLIIMMMRAGLVGRRVDMESMGRCGWLLSGLLVLLLSYWLVSPLSGGIARDMRLATSLYRQMRDSSALKLADEEQWKRPFSYSPSVFS